MLPTDALSISHQSCFMSVVALHNIFIVDAAYDLTGAVKEESSGLQHAPDGVPCDATRSSQDLYNLSCDASVRYDPCGGCQLTARDRRPRTTQACCFMPLYAAPTNSSGSEDLGHEAVDLHEHDKLGVITQRASIYICACWTVSCVTASPIQAAVFGMMMHTQAGFR